MVIQITITLEKEEFEPMLIELCNKAYGQQIDPEQFKSIRFDSDGHRPLRMTAIVERTGEQNG